VCQRCAHRASNVTGGSVSFKSHTWRKGRLCLEGSEVTGENKCSGFWTPQEEPVNPVPCTAPGVPLPWECMRRASGQHREQRRRGSLSWLGKKA